MKFKKILIFILSVIILISLFMFIFSDSTVNAASEKYSTSSITIIPQGTHWELYRCSNQDNPGITTGREAALKTPFASVINCNDASCTKYGLGEYQWYKQVNDSYGTYFKIWYTAYEEWVCTGYESAKNEFSYNGYARNINGNYYTKNHHNIYNSVGSSDCYVYPVNCWINDFGPDANGRRNNESKWYYVDSEGYIVKGWFYAPLHNCVIDTAEYNNDDCYGWFYAGSDGVVLSGWNLIDGKYFYFRRNYSSNLYQADFECVTSMVVDNETVFTETLDNRYLAYGKRPSYISEIRLPVNDYIEQSDGTYPSSPSYVRYISITPEINSSYAYAVSNTSYKGYHIISGRGTNPYISYYVRCNLNNDDFYRATVLDNYGNKADKNTFNYYYARNICYIDYSSGLSNNTGVPSSTVCYYNTNVTLPGAHTVSGRSYYINFDSNTGSYVEPISGNLSFKSWTIFNDNSSYGLTFERNYMQSEVLYKPNFSANNGVHIKGRANWNAKTIDSFPTPVKDNYEFTGWFDKNGNRITSLNIYPDTKSFSITLTAGWKPKKARQKLYVRYQDNNGEFGSYELISDKDYTIGDNFSFKVNDSDCYVGKSLEYVVTEAKTSYLDIERKKYNFTFNGSETSDNSDNYTIYIDVSVNGSLIESDTVYFNENLYYGSLIKLSDIKTEEGYHLEKYIEESNLYEHIGNPYEFILKNKTVIKAVVNPNEYIIHFDANKPAGITNPVTGSMSDISAKYNEALRLPSCSFSIPGWNFVNWNTRKDGTGKSFNDLSEVINLTALNNHTVPLYAIWNKKQLACLKIASNIYNISITNPKSEKINDEWYNSYGTKNINQMEDMKNEDFKQIWCIKEGVVTQID